MEPERHAVPFRDAEEHLALAGRWLRLLLQRSQQRSAARGGAADPRLLGPSPAVTLFAGPLAAGATPTAASPGALDALGAELAARGTLPYQGAEENRLRAVQRIFGLSGDDLEI